MQDWSDDKLLSRYSTAHDEGAFGELVRRHIDLVYSAARRLVQDAHLAEDVTQSVFVALAKDAVIVASRLRNGAPLSAWLHLTTRNVAANIVRTETRRRHREQAALAMQTPATEEDDEAIWNRIASHLDPALAELAEPDRDAVLLRFFERKTAREIGHRLGISEEAAQKRVQRAVDRLRSIFVSRGLAVPSASLTGVLTVHAIQAAPAALASSVTAIAVAGVPAGTAGVTGTGILTIMASTQLKTGIAVLLAAGAVTIGLLQQREIQRLRTQPTPVLAPSPGAPPPPSTASSAPDPATAEELLRLRGEVARLRREVSESRSAPVRPRDPALPGSPVAQNVPARELDEAFRALRLARMHYTKDLTLALQTYANAHNGQYPTSLEDASAEIEQVASSSPLDPSQFEVLFKGSMAELSNPSQAIILRERSVHPRRDGQPGFTRCYGFGDGHSEIRTSPDGNFDAWEQEHQPNLKPAPTGGAAP